MSRNMSRPRSDFRLSVTPFLLEFSSRKNHASSPRLSDSAVRPCSPEGGSILTTSAPSHASICVALGPASYCVKSRTRIPSRAFAIEWPPIVEPIIEARPGFAGTLRTLGGVGGHFGAPSSQHPVIEERPGFAGALRTLGGVGGHFGAPHAHVWYAEKRTVCARA